MKTTLLMAFLLSGGLLASAQTTTTVAGSTGDGYQGMSRSIPNGRVLIPYGLEVTYDKTTHIIFPSNIRYTDLGSANIIGQLAGEATNVLRVKAAHKDFETETNLTVICEDGSSYSFNVKYAEEPQKLTVEMKDFLSDGADNLPTNRADIYFKELGSESPVLVKLIMKTIHQMDKRQFKHLGTKLFGMRFLLKGLYTHNGLLYFHTSLINDTHMPYNVDFISWKIVDRKVSKRTAIQERVLPPLRAYNQVSMVGGKSEARSIFALELFTLADDKHLEITLHERNGGRHLTFYLEQADLIQAKAIDNLKLKL